MMQRTGNENAAGLRRICKRSDQPKIERLENKDLKREAGASLKILQVEKRTFSESSILTDFRGR